MTLKMIPFRDLKVFKKRPRRLNKDQFLKLLKLLQAYKRNQ